MIHKE